MSQPNLSPVLPSKLQRIVVVEDMTLVRPFDDDHVMLSKRVTHLKRQGLITEGAVCMLVWLCNPEGCNGWASVDEVYRVAPMLETKTSVFLGELLRWHFVRIIAAHPEAFKREDLR